MQALQVARLEPNLRQLLSEENRIVFMSHMSAVHIRDLDLNLMVLAEVVYRHRNLTAAAAELGLTPSAVSHALGRLGDYYRAPLFVRAARGVVPTQLGLRLEAEIRGFRTVAQRLLERDGAFEPAKAEGRIYIATTEYFELVLGPKLIAALRREAPQVQLCFLDAQGPYSYRALETRQVDLAVAGFFRDLPEALSRRRLFRDGFATLAGGKLPRRRALTLEEYLRADHLLITMTGDLEGRVDLVLRRMGHHRRVIAGTGSFASPAWLLREQDLVLTAPRLLLERYRELLGWKAYPCPVEVPPLEMQMVWHQRTQKDPLRQWVRERIAALCKEIA